jgi:MFS transporter, DHA2 family, multidrug resistance protein
MIAGLLYGLEKKPPHWELLKSTDYAGIITLAMGLGCLQVFLEEGHRKDWLESTLIVQLGSVAVVSLILFVILQLSRPNPLINLGILRERNFGLTSIASLGMGLGLYGSIYLLPLYLAQIQNYNALQIGQVIMWMGIPQLFLIPLVPKLMKIIPQNCYAPQASPCSASPALPPARSIRTLAATSSIRSRSSARSANQ